MFIILLVFNRSQDQNLFSGEIITLRCLVEDWDPFPAWSWHKCRVLQWQTFLFRFSHSWTSGTVVEDKQVLCLNSKDCWTRGPWALLHITTSKSTETFTCLLSASCRFCISSYKLWIYLLAKAESLGGEQQRGRIRGTVVKLFKFVWFFTVNYYLWIN